METQRLIQSLRSARRVLLLPKVQKYLYHGAWIGFSLFVLVNAWVSEDAFITLRVLDNFFHGYGLRWNITERVQVYTHPLWLLLHIPLNAIIANPFVTNVVLSVACTTGAVVVTLATARKPLFFTMAFFFLPLLASKAFHDYSTSGLENPLSYVLFTSFCYLVLKKYEHPKFWLYVSLNTACALLNRLDMAVFFGPALIWLAYTRFRDIRWTQVILGALPLVVWFCFSLFYYGFLLPNTAYAKLGTGLPFYRYVNHGLDYAQYTLVTDTMTALEILFPLIFIALALRKHVSPVHLALFPVCIALGLYWYVLYILSIGGDYMVGRFWAFPAFVGVWLLYVCTPFPISRRFMYGWIAILLLLGQQLEPSWWLRKQCSICSYKPDPMIDARYMFSGNFLIPHLHPFAFNTVAHHKFVGWSLPLVKKAPGHIEKAHYIGMLGYYSGPGNIFIDELALADPLLARLPIADNGKFLTGHFYRTMPAGYMEAVRTGSTMDMDPSLALYYTKLRLITSGDLTDPERLKTIIAFNLGEYDHWKQAYLACNIW